MRQAMERMGQIARTAGKRAAIALEMRTSSPLRKGDFSPDALPDIEGRGTLGPSRITTISYARGCLMKPFRTRMLVSAASESPIMKARALNLNSKDIYVDFTEAIFRTVADEAQCPCSRTPLSATLVYRPALFRRNEIRWIAAYAWRSNQRTRGLAALKQAKEALDASILKEAATSISGLIHEIFGDKPVDAITGIPCGHSRRADCFGKQLARSVANMVGLPFLQIFADRPCPDRDHQQ